jgi:outer membrane biosynthesis protein TonB
MKEDWTEQLKRKLEGHKMPPPEGLWEDISKQMGFSAEPVRKPTAIKRLYWVAAAAILALVGFFVFQNVNDSEQPQQANAISQQPASQRPVSEQSVSEQPISEQPSSQQPVNQTPLLAHAHQQPVAESQKEEEILPDSSTDSSAEVQQTLDEPQQTEDLALQAEKHDEPQPSTQSYETLPPEKALPSTLPLGSSKNSQHDKWSMGLNASGGLLAVNTFQRTDRLYSQHGTFTYNGDKDKSYEGDGPVGPQGQGGHGGLGYETDNYQGYHLGNSYSYTLTEFVSKHHLPIRFGLSVQYQLNNHLALHSGISYTYLYSEFSIPLYQNLSYDQKLHYLGIPLGVTWQLWNANRFRFYLSGGAMVEKCVRADVDGSSVSKKPWQWSVATAAGAEYTFIPQLGVYLEPSLGYYFDDGTSLEHYYKEHSLAPSIMFGLRLHLNE